MRFPTKYLLFLLLSFAAPLAAKEQKEPVRLEPTSRMRTETRYVVYSVEQLHYVSNAINNLDINKLLNTYMGDLDIHKLFYMESDVKEYKSRFAKILPIYLKQQGNLYPAFEMFKTYRERAHERVAWIHERLTQPFSFSAEESYAPDRRKVDWAKSENELNALWEQRLKYELLNEILIEEEDEKISLDEVAEAAEDAEPLEELTERPLFQKRLKEGIENVGKRYTRFLESLNEIEASEVQEIFLTSLTQMYDPHSVFLSSDSLEDFSVAIKNSLVGIGAMLYRDEGYCTVRELLPGGPAEKSKQINPTDRIVGVGEGEYGEIVDVIGMRLKKIVKMIRGKEGTPLRLVIQPADGDPSSRKTITLIREQIQLTSKLAKAELFEVPINGRDDPVLVGVINLPTFYGASENVETGNDTSKDVEELIGKLKAFGVEGLILDLRRNGGGLLLEAIELAGIFIPTGPILQVKDTIGQINEYKDHNPEIAWDGPMIVLVSRYSASASEIVAGALQNHGRALIVGDEATHGKGTVQGVFEMDRSLFGRATKPQMGAAKITIQKFYLPDGNSTQVKGVISDISMPSINMHLPIAESDLDYPLEWDTIDPVSWDYAHFQSQYKAPVNEEVVAALKAKSEVRQRALPEFHYLHDSIEWLRERQDQKVYSLNFDERYTQRAADRAFRDMMDDRLEELSQTRFEGKEILLAVAEEKAKEAEETKKAKEAEKAEKAKESGSADEETAEKEEEEEPDFDIYLQESLRIMGDWVQLLDPQTAPLSFARGHTKAEKN